MGFSDPEPFDCQIIQFVRLSIPLSETRYYV